MTEAKEKTKMIRLVRQAHTSQIQGIHISEKVVFIGKTGVGKSSLINMFYNDSSYHTDLLKPAIIGQSSLSTTKEYLKYFSAKSGTCYIDTVGLCDTKNSHESFTQLSKFIRSLHGCRSKIVFVLEAGKMTDETHSMINNLTLILGEDWTRKSLIIFTRARTDFDVDVWAQIEKTECSDDKLRAINKILECQDVQYIDNNLDPMFASLYDTLRHKFFERCKSILKQKERYIEIHHDVIDIIVNIGKILNQNTIIEVDAMKTYVEKCPICQDEDSSHYCSCGYGMCKNCRERCSKCACQKEFSKLEEVEFETFLELS